jgi:polysaccharide export outer membrane protein
LFSGRSRRHEKTGRGDFKTLKGLKMGKAYLRLYLFFAIALLVALLPLAHGESIDYKEIAAKHYRAGSALYEQGDYAAAAVEYQKALDSLDQLNKEGQSDGKVSIKPLSRGAAEYSITEEDELRVSVWQNDDLNQEVVVRPDGRISFPLIGDVIAKGLTISQLDAEITDRLKEFIKFPEVSISLKKMGGRKVVVLGEVENPGVYSVTGAHTIIQAIGLAGGFTRDSVPSSTVLIRGGLEKPQASRLNLSLALKGDLGQNPALQAEDIIFVPKKFIANVNYFLAQVLEPLSRGAYISQQLQTW